ncbi:MAG: alkaline phosphatase family protein [Gammaproteobacteria bacterium]|nr:alkaline phosphatase family protein [Gammaproteobacteria bacterium]
MSKPLVVINIVGLTPSLLGNNTPKLNALIKDGFMAPLQPAFPAVTCTAQSTMLTGLTPEQHGIVGNGWYFRDMSEILFWRQSNHLVQGEKVWDAARQNDSSFSCAKMFWWYNMYANVEWSVTPRPAYPADGRKIPGIYTQPPELNSQLQSRLGSFPLFNFWGPTADIRSSKWIADSAREVFDLHRPKLNLVYLPHLDYNLQRLGPDDPGIAEDVRQIDQVAGDLIDHVKAKGANVMVVSEYGIEQATGPVHINRILREAGYLQVQETLGWELLDAGASKAFAVADHQIAHIYIKNHQSISTVKKLLEKIPGISRVLDSQGKKEFAIDHQRSGELIAIAEKGHWFSYYYWLDEAKAPDFAPTVDIHRKPGYDPAELFIDPEISFPKLKVAERLLQKKLGFRTLLDVIPLNGNQVKGTHGRLFENQQQGPLVIVPDARLESTDFQMTDIKELILKLLQ